MPILNFQILERYPRITIMHHLTQNGTIWATIGRNVVYKKDNEWQCYSKFPKCLPRDLFGFSRPSARAVRSDKCNVYMNSFDKVMGIRGGRVYVLDQNKQAHMLFSIQGDCVLHRSLCEDEEGWTYFGEYFMNPNRLPVRIWRVSPELNSWEPAYEFGSGEIRHIHGIYRDPFERGVLWISVGDFSGECFLIRSTDRFKTIRQFGDGSQHWRAVNLFFTADHVAWLTDSNLEQNHAFRLARRSGELEMGQKMNASTWYGCTTREGLHLAFTTVERGPAIQSNESAVLVSEDAFHWQKIYGFKKDFYRPVQLFKYGVISCPAGEMNLDEVYLSGEGLVGFDGCSIKAQITTEKK
jgi:hypothetical protein